MQVGQAGDAGQQDGDGARAPRFARPALPIDAHRDEIAALLRAHPVVIVCGETGSGKTTQLPQIALAAGRGGQGVIAHTQPRRLAARAVAARIAVEMGTELGSLVGYQVRFDARAGARTRIRLMTDGILLAELADDPLLSRYDTIIIDEAHERSLNVDLLLGALRGILARRRDLRVIVTSATIEPQRFSDHFGGAPIVEVAGRLFPITIEQRDAGGSEFDDPAAPEAVVPAVLEALDRVEDGDVLVFVPGEREISECLEALEPEARRRGLELIRLSARLPAEEQDRVLRPAGRRRVVLSTNVAETSLTVPRIRAVIDSGVARLRRYSSRARVERLLVEPISRASAAQRAGRCGRVGPGLCIRLYSEASLLERTVQTTPEILRSNLAGVVLRMKASGLGDPTTFPFIDPPAPRLWQDGIDTLVELGAIDRRGGLTPIGRRMALLPVDPRTARMLLAARDSDCLSEVLPIAAALSVQDPVVAAPNPGGGEGAPVIDAPAPRAVLRARHPDSDFLTLLRLWHEIAEAKRSRGSSAMARWCREEGLAPRRVREWVEVHDQLARLEVESWRRRTRRPRGAAPAMNRREPGPIGAGGGRSNEGPDGATTEPRPLILHPSRESEIHRAILAGFVSQIGRRQEDGSYLGVQGGAFVLHRGSVLARRTAVWIVAAEIVDTGRRTARTVARIQGDWVERVAPHLVKRQHSEPHFLPETGHVAAWEKVTFGGLVLTPRRRVPYEPVDPEGSRQVFIHAALVEEQLRTPAPFLEHNRSLRERMEGVEHKRRERGLLADVEARFAFYDARVPRSVVNAASFGSWRRHAEAKDPRVLFMRESDLLRTPVDVSDFPDATAAGGEPLPLRYEHAPGAPADGVTLTVPLDALRRVDADAAEWLVPGMLQAKIEALIRALPKRVRQRFSPAREFAAGAFEHLGGRPTAGSLRRALADYLTKLGGVSVEPSDFDIATLPTEMSMRYEVVDEEGRTLDEGRDLAALQRRWAPRAAARFEEMIARAARTLEATARTSWDFPSIPERVELADGLGTAFPAVVDEGATVGVRLLASAEEAGESMRLGLRRLAQIELASPIEHHLTFHPAWPEIEELWRSLEPGSDPVARLSPVVAEHAALLPPVPRTAADFEAKLADAAPRMHQSADRVATLALRLLRARAALERALAAASPPDWSMTRESIAEHLKATAVPLPFDACIDDIVLAAEALESDLSRWSRLPRGGVERDRVRSALLTPWIHRASAAITAHPLGSTRHAEARRLVREVERFRIRLWAQDSLSARVEEGLQELWSRLA